MQAPRIEIELDKLAHNAQKLRALYGSKGICVTAVTKGVCGSPRIVSALLNSGIRSFGDSRIANIGIAAQHHTLNDTTDGGPLVKRHFVFQTQVAPAIPVIEKYLAQA
jgi:predicted amino acid racemase